MFELVNITGNYTLGAKQRQIGGEGGGGGSELTAEDDGGRGAHDTEESGVRRGVVTGRHSGQILLGRGRKGSPVSPKLHRLRSNTLWLWICPYCHVIGNCRDRDEILQQIRMRRSQRALTLFNALRLLDPTGRVNSAV